MGSVLLPISPESFSLKIKNANKTLTLINEGEINILRDAGLTELDFKVLIPAVQYSFAKYDDGFKRPSYYLDYFEKLKTSKQPFQFIVSRKLPDGKMLFDTNMKVSLEDYKVDEKSQEGFDLVVSISLKQYKYYGTKTVRIFAKKILPPPNTKTEKQAINMTDYELPNVGTVETQREQENSPAPKKPVIYVTTEEDKTWTNVMKKYYGTDMGKVYMNVRNLNEKALAIPSMNMGRLPAGVTLIFPPLEELLNDNS
jgi:hypothetical protein